MTSLEKLKELFQRQTRREVLSCSLLPSGLPKGAITEVSGFGKTELVTRFLAEHEEIRVAWIEETFSVFPFAFQQRRVDLKRVLFVEAGEDLTWAALQILKSQIFGIVVLYAETLSLTHLRR